MRTLRIGALAACTGVFLAGSARAVVLGQVDDFENGTTQGWLVGMPAAPAPPVNVADGGPAGAGDAYLRVRGVGGTGPTSKPTVFNQVQWKGDYTGTGVLQISADLRNLGNTELDMRLLITRDFALGGQRFMAAAVHLPPGSGWVRAVWRVAASALLPADFIPGDPALALRQVGELRIFHGGPCIFPGPGLVAELGIDNVRAEIETPDFDGDGALNAADNCPFFPNASQGDVDTNGRGDACECGDQNADGRVNVVDLVQINLAIFNPLLVTPLCDTNCDLLCNVTDIVGANQEIFSPGKTSRCSRQPVPGP
jgi:hypothetical protein